jgi:hypothetical protein
MQPHVEKEQENMEIAAWFKAKSAAHSKDGRGAPKLPDLENNYAL